MKSDISTFEANSCNSRKKSNRICIVTKKSKEILKPTRSNQILHKFRLNVQCSYGLTPSCSVACFSVLSHEKYIFDKCWGLDLINKCPFEFYFQEQGNICTKGRLYFIRGKKLNLKSQKTVTPPHIGPTLAPEAILFESPCRAHSET